MRAVVGWSEIVEIGDNGGKDAIDTSYEEEWPNGEKDIKSRVNGTIWVFALVVADGIDNAGIR
jgi:hypothetical protein